MEFPHANNDGHVKSSFYMDSGIQELLSAVSLDGITVSPELFAPFCGYIKYTPL